MKKWFLIIPVILIVLLILFLNNPYNPRIILSKYLSTKGFSYYSNGEHDLDKAEKYFKASLYLNPRISGVHYQLARIYLVEGYLEDAQAEIGKEIEIHPENKRSLYIKGLIDSYLGKFEESEGDFRQFIQWSPDEWAGYADISWVYISDHKYQEALEATGTGIEKFPENAWLYSNRGLAFYRLARYDEARQALEKAKMLAEGLTENDWRNAYPGNDPSGAKEGARDIKAAISYNLGLVYKAKGNIEKFTEEHDYYNSLFPEGGPEKEKFKEII